MPSPRLPPRLLLTKWPHIFPSGFASRGCKGFPNVFQLYEGTSSGNCSRGADFTHQKEDCHLFSWDTSAASLCLLGPHPAQLLHGEDQEEKQLEVMCQLANETHLHLKQPLGKTMTGVWQKSKQMSVVLKFYGNVTRTVISNAVHALLFPSVFTHQSQN